MMAIRPAVRDIRTYLRDNDWQQSLTWRGAVVWSHAEGYEVLLPPRDDLPDADLRVRELLKVLSTVEQRPMDDIVVDIGAPLDDIQSFRIFQEGIPSGFTPLGTGIRVLQGVRSLIGVTARTVVEGPLPAFPAGAPASVADLVQRVRLGPGRPGSYIFTVRVPVDNPPTPGPADDDLFEPLGRQVSRQFHEAITAVQAATVQSTPDDLSAFDDTVTAGVSADLCGALSALAGDRSAQAFEVAFRWSWGLPTDLPTDAVRFAEGSGTIIRGAARHLKRVQISGPAEMTGSVVMLQNQAQITDRWRIKVRGDLTFHGSVGFGRTVWVQLDGPAAYDRAISAHRADHLVRVTGTMSAARGRQGGRPLAFRPLPAFDEFLKDPDNVDDQDEFDQAVEAAVEAIAPRLNAHKATDKANIERAVLKGALRYFGGRGGNDLGAFTAFLAALPSDASPQPRAPEIAAKLAEKLEAVRENDPLFGGAGEPADPGMLLTPPDGKRARVSVISMIGLTDEQRPGFVNQLQMALFSWIKKHPAGDRPLGGLLVMDEAQTVAPAVGATASTQSTLKLASQARKYGLGLLFATQAPRALHNQIPNNAATQFFGRLASPAQIDTVQELARTRGGNVPDIGRLGTGEFYLGLEGRGLQKVRTPQCLSFHPTSPLTEEEVLARARRS